MVNFCSVFRYQGQMPLFLGSPPWSPRSGQVPLLGSFILFFQNYSFQSVYYLPDIEVNNFQDIIHLGSMYWEYSHVTNAEPEAWMQSECCPECERAGKWPNQNSETLNTSPSPKHRLEWHIEHSHMLNIYLQNIRKKCSSNISMKDTTY